MPPTIAERTRSQSDPVRNFKFQVGLFHPDHVLQAEIAKMGFTSVQGIGMSTDVATYREGGWNTNLHKMPGFTDFPPLTMSSGVFYTKPGMWDLAKQMFAVQWGQGTIAMGNEFRFDMLVRVLDHPVTAGAASGVQGKPDGAVLAFTFYNAWCANVNFNGLDATASTGVLVHEMTVVHEGMDVFFGNVDALNLRHGSR